MFYNLMHIRIFVKSETVSDFFQCTKSFPIAICNSLFTPYTVGYATMNECYNEQFLSIKSGCYNENRCYNERGGP
jgi:hypothetical protein